MTKFRPFLGQQADSGRQVEPARFNICAMSRTARAQAYAQERDSAHKEAERQRRQRINELSPLWSNGKFVTVLLAYYGFGMIAAAIIIMHVVR